jgi:hypothetical protein
MTISAKAALLHGFALLLCSSAMAVMAGEIIVGSGTDRARSGRASAADLRERAKSQRTENDPAVPLSSIVEELDDGPFGGRSGAAATDNRQRARAYQQQGTSGTPSGNVGGTVTPSTIEQLMVDPDSNQGRVKSNLERARAYQRGESPGVTNPHFGGTENLPLVDCKDVGSVTGRIGDDNVSGSVIVVMRNGKGVKVRCR